MPVIRVKSFAGAIPALNVRATPDRNAALAMNLRLNTGALEPINEPRPVTSGEAFAQVGFMQSNAVQVAPPAPVELDPGTRSVYRIPTGDPIDLTTSHWMQFSDVHTDVLRTPNVNDTFERYYWASDATDLMYNSRARILADLPPYAVGVPAPSVAAALAVTGTGTGPTVTRSYVVTFRSVFGEESQPSPPVEGVGKPDQSWNLSAIPQPPALPPSTQVPITAIRIYRTITSASGSTVFHYVAEIAPGVTTYTDTQTDSVVSGRGVLESTTWAPPPSMDGVVAMPNGFFVGFKGNNLFVSEAFRPHAWPVSYQLSVQYPIVGLGVFGNTCVICTTGEPATLTGVNPGSLSLTTLSAPFPCVGRGSIVSTPAGVAFATEEGIILIGPGGVTNVTAGLFDRYVWRSSYFPETIEACFVEGQYFGLFTLPDGVTAKAFMFNPAELPGGVIVFDDFVAGARPYVDQWSGRPLLVQGEQVVELLPVTGVGMTLVWRSKEFQLPLPANMAVAQLFFDQPPLPTGTEVKLLVWADRRLVFEQFIPTSAKEVRLPSGYKADIWQFEVQSKVRVNTVYMANSAKELRGG